MHYKYKKLVMESTTLILTVMLLQTCVMHALYVSIFLHFLFRVSTSFIVKFPSNFFCTRPSHVIFYQFCNAIILD